MIDPIFLTFDVMLIFSGPVIGYFVGRHVTRWPREEAMIERLIVARVQRLMLGVSERDIKVEVQRASDRLAIISRPEEPAQ